MATTTRPRLVIVPGDFSGIGPELTARLLADPSVRARADLAVTATAAELREAAAAAGVESILDGGGPSTSSGDGDGPSTSSGDGGGPSTSSGDGGGPSTSSGDGGGPSTGSGDVGDSRNVTVLGTRWQGAPIAVGTVSAAAGERALTDLGTALDRCAAGDADGVLFLPLNKAALGRAGMAEEDELRWFARRLGFDGFTSELNFISSLVTARVTSHVPVSQIADGIRSDRVLQTITLLDRVLRETRTSNPRIAVCALNPHAGEGGKFGREEIDEIAPGVALAQSRGIDVDGPYPCDTVFGRAADQGFHGVVTMYHDQGQIAMKLLGFDHGVTVHGGLPVPIATPAHGTAHEIVGTGTADLGPSLHAFALAVDLAAARRHHPRTDSGVG